MIYFRKYKSELALLIVTLMWGLTFPAIHVAMRSIDAFTFVALRFGIATLCFIPLFVLKQKKSKQSWKRALKPGLILGLFVYGSYFTQTYGLQTVPSGRAAFITGLFIILVPLLSPLFGSGRVLALDLIGAVVALLGVYLLTDVGDGGFSSGDLWVLACAVMNAFHIQFLSKFSKQNYDSKILAFYQVCMTAIIASLTLPIFNATLPVLRLEAVVGLVFCSVFATVIAFQLQSKYQAHVSAEKASLIFAAEPVFASFFGWVILNEIFTLKGFIGAFLILSSIIGTEIFRARFKK